MLKIFLEENPEIAIKIEKQIREKLGLPIKGETKKSAEAA